MKKERYHHYDDTALFSLYCYNNQLTTLDVSNNKALTFLSCYNNQLTTLDVSNNKALTYLFCGNNQLTTLDVSTTKLNAPEWRWPLSCNMESLKTLYLKTGWEINGINLDRNSNYIYPTTQIEYKN